MGGVPPEVRARGRRGGGTNPELCRGRDWSLEVPRGPPPHHSLYAEYQLSQCLVGVGCWVGGAGWR